MPSLPGGVDGPGSIEGFRGVAHRQGQWISYGLEPILHLGSDVSNSSQVSQLSQVSHLCNEML